MSQCTPLTDGQTEFRPLTQRCAQHCQVKCVPIHSTTDRSLPDSYNVTNYLLNTIHIQCCSRHVVGIHCTIHCSMPAWKYETKPEKICRRLTSYIKSHVTTLLSIHITWRLNALIIDMLQIMTSPHPMYCCIMV